MAIRRLLALLVLLALTAAPFGRLAVGEAAAPMPRATAGAAAAAMHHGADSPTARHCPDSPRAPDDQRQAIDCMVACAAATAAAAQAPVPAPDSASADPPVEVVRALIGARPEADPPPPRSVSG